MTARIAFLSILTLLSPPLASAVTPPLIVKRADKSPSGDFRIEHRHNGDFNFSMWLVPERNPDCARLLFKPADQNESHRDPDLLISPDEQCIARTQVTGSTCTKVVLHRRQGPFQYRQSGDLENPVWRFVEKSFGLAPGKLRPLHRDLVAVRWLDANRLLLRLTGDFPPVEEGFVLTDWYCVYHTDKKTFSVLPEHKAANAKALTRGKTGE